MPRPVDTGTGRKKVARKKGATEVEQAARTISKFVGKPPVRVKEAPKVRQVKKAAAVKIARSGEQQARKLPVAVPKNRKEQRSIEVAVKGRKLTTRNRSAGAAIEALNERSLAHRALSSPKIAQRTVQKDALKDAMAQVNRGVQSRGTPVKGKARAKAIEDLTSGKSARIKSVGPFTRKQLEDEKAVVRTEKNAQLPSPLRKVRYEKPATDPVRKQAQKQIKRADPAALKLLDLAARPFYAGANAATAAAKGENVGKAAERGIKGQEKGSYRDALGESGAPKWLANVLGTVGDFVLDPVNLISAGSVSTARKAGEKAARDAAKKGLSEGAARKAALAAMRAVEDSGKNRVGAVVKVAGKEVPVVRRVVSKKVNIEKERVKAEKMRPSAREVVHGVSPRKRPLGVKESDHVSFREAATDARATRDTLSNETRRVSRSARKHIRKGEGAKISEAAEKLDLSKLDPDTRVIAGRTVDYMRRMDARRKAVGLEQKRGGENVAEGEAKGYFPHYTPKALRGGTEPGQGGGLSRTVTDRSREDLRPMADINAESVAVGRGKKFEDEDVATALAMYGTQQSTKIARAQFNKRIAEDAPRYKAGRKLGEGESVYTLKNGTLERVSDVDVAKGKIPSGAFRLHDESYDRFVKELEPLDRGRPGVAFDKANAAWKRLALATPGFYVRNLIGEATMGYMGTKGARGTARYVKAGAKDSPKVLKRVRQRELAELDAFDPKAAPLPKSGKTIKVAGKQQNLDDFIDQARADGVLRKGQQGNELRELQEGLGEVGSVPKGKRALKARENAHSAASTIEDYWRFASYKANLDAGMSRQEARRRALDFHFDYGELTRFERQARRVLPFWTFNARALEMYSRAALTSPKKLSAIEKSRETVSDLTGVEGDYREGAKTYQKRQVPIVARIGGDDLMLQMGLPVGLLNEAPVSLIEGLGKMATGDVAGAAGKAWSQNEEWFMFGMGLLTPFIKVPIEYGANHSYFFRGDIEPEGRRLVSAPNYFEPLVGTPVGDMLGLTRKYEDKQGRVSLGYRAKADYLLKQIPGAAAILNRLIASGTNRRGQSQSQELVAALTGINPDPVDRNSAGFERVYDEKDRVTAQLGDLRQTEGGADSDAYKRLKAREKELDREIERLMVERYGKSGGKAKRKVRKSSSSSGDWWESSGSSSGSSSSSSGGTEWWK